MPAAVGLCASNLAVYSGVVRSAVKPGTPDTTNITHSSRTTRNTTNTAHYHHYRHEQGRGGGGDSGGGLVGSGEYKVCGLGLSW